MSMEPARINEIDPDRVRHIAHLARLHLSDAEVQSFSKQLTELIGYFNTLGEVNVEGVPPANLLSIRSGEMRPDEPQPSLARDEFLAGAPVRDGNFVRVPPVFGSE